jgi:hypothetical protein
LVVRSAIIAVVTGRHIVVMNAAVLCVTPVRRAGILIVAVDRPTGHAGASRTVISVRAGIAIVAGRGIVRIDAVAVGARIRGARVVIVAVQRATATHSSQALVAYRARIAVVTRENIVSMDA